MSTIRTPLSASISYSMARTLWDAILAGRVKALYQVYEWSLLDTHLNWMRENGWIGVANKRWYIRNPNAWVIIERMRKVS